jgi:hypothetical protein
MKTLLPLLPILLSSIVLVAHFMRDGDYLLFLVCLAFPLILLVRRDWLVWTVQIAFLFASAEWAEIAMGSIRERQVLGQPRDRLAIILGAVALGTAASAFVFRLNILKQRYESIVEGT